MSYLTANAKIELLQELKKHKKNITQKEIRRLIIRYKIEAEKTKHKAVRIQEKNKPQESVNEYLDRLDREADQRQLTLNL